MRVDFHEGGKAEYPEKPLGVRLRWTENQPTCDLKARVEPGSQRQEARLITARLSWLPPAKPVFYREVPNLVLSRRLGASPPPPPPFHPSGVPLRCMSPSGSPSWTFLTLSASGTTIRLFRKAVLLLKGWKTQNVRKGKMSEKFSCRLLGVVLRLEGISDTGNFDVFGSRQHLPIKIRPMLESFLLFF